MDKGTIFSDSRYIRFRKIENLHILFWLIKDLCWLMEYRVIGMFMIIPTLFISIYFTFKNYKIPAELFHNLAIAIWIMTNSAWMISEFYAFDEMVKPYLWIPFSLGFVLLAYYYLVYEIFKIKKIKQPVSFSEQPEVDSAVIH